MTELQQIKNSVNLLEKRLANHSKYVLENVMPFLEGIRSRLDRLWISDQRFRDLERAVADIAATVYRDCTKHSPDERVRPH